MALQVDPDGECRSEGIYKTTERRSLKWSYLKAHLELWSMSRCPSEDQ